MTFYGYLEQESFHLGSSSSNINPSMRTPLPYGSFEVHLFLIFLFLIYAIEDLNHFMNYLSQGSFHLGTSTGVMNPIMTVVPYGASQVSLFPSFYF
jgi:hypothetical protein